MNLISCNQDYVLSKTIFLLLYIVFGAFLLYTNYLQELYLFTIAFRLPSFEVSIKTFQYLRANTQLPEASLFPELDLFYIGPTFLEHGKLSLECSYQIFSIICHADGEIPQEKTYLTKTFFKNSKNEKIEFKFNNDDNRSNVEKLANYLDFQLFLNVKGVLPEGNAYISIPRYNEHHEKIIEICQLIHYLVKWRYWNFFFIAVSLISLSTSQAIIYQTLKLRPQRSSITVDESAEEGKVIMQNLFLYRLRLVSVINIFCYCIHYVLYYTIGFLLKEAIKRCYTFISGDINFVGGEEKYNFLFTICGLIFNTFVFSCLHLSFGLFLFLYSKKFYTFL